MRHPTVVPLLPLLIALGVLVPVLGAPGGAALAQFGGSAPRGPMTPSQAGPGGRPPPAALPGLAGRPRSEPIPGDAPSASLSPNAALFDAINRGDMAAAREAMSRGADLDSRNALGLAPVDAAVDQGRNDIAFYLLSARAGSRPAPGPEEAAAVVPPPRARSGGREASRPAAKRGPAREASQGKRPAVERLPARAERAPPGGGGTPRPEAGFLGFDAGRGG